MTLAVSAQDVADYIGIDPKEFDETVERNINRQLPAANRFVIGEVGENCDAEDPRFRELVIMAAGELYSTRGVMSAKQEASLRRIAVDFIRQLKLEGRGDS